MKQSIMTKTDMYDFLLENDIATTKEINLVICIMGYTKEVLIDILKVRTGYDFDQYTIFAKEEYNPMVCMNEIK